MPIKAYEAPAETATVDGEVVLTGPGRLHGSMTPDAAEETGRRLTAAAQKARRQASTPEPEATYDAAKLQPNG
jgi:uncharacterized protein YciW